MLLDFQPIDFKQHSQVCIEFRVYSFVASFGDADRFHEEDGRGADRYLDWLREKSKADPRSCVHIWFEGQIIGQIEMGRFKSDPAIGYVNLFYLRPQMRGRGMASHLQRYAIDYFRSIGLKKARLSVSPTNARAVAYYKKHGWRDLGPRPGHPEVHLMEIDIQDCEEILESGSD